ncbi:MAG: YciI family protein [Alphaproteobacteria bacterium]|nr:YciI family protein [Alphaproteobacteria bacterium]
MFFTVYSVDKPFSAGLRSVTRDQHLAYLAASGTTIRFAGPLMSEDGEKMVGSFLVLEADSLAAARNWAANDPYAKVGLFESSEVRPWRFLFEKGVRREG